MISKPGRKHQLGRKAVQTDSRTLQLAKYLPSTLPPPPTSIDWTKGVTSFGAMLNDTLGDCTIAGLGHAIQIWTLNASTEVTLPDSNILQYYEWWDGYVDGNPATDQGGVEIVVLKHFLNHTFQGYQLKAFAAASLSNHTEVMQSVSLFGGAYIGLLVPNYIMNTDNPPAVWDVPTVGDDTGIDGGHCVWLVGYTATGPTFVSWGGVYTMTWAFWDAYVDENWALVSPTFIAANGVSPSDFDMAQLEADLALIA